MNTTAIFKVTVAIIIGLTAGWAYRQWLSRSFWQAACLCAAAAALVVFLLDTFGNHVVILPGNVDEHIHDKTSSVLRSLALGGLVFLIAVNYKLATLVANLFLFKLNNKQ